MNATATHTSPQILTPEEIAEQEEMFARAAIVEETSRSLASDLLDRALQIELGEAHYLLIQVADSNLLGFNRGFSERAKELAAHAEKLLDQANDMFVRSYLGRPRFLKEKGVISIEDQIDMFRQEIFWSSSDPTVRPEKRPSLQRSESLIFKLLELYQDIERFRCEIDRSRKDGIPSGRHQAPRWQPNRYQEICSA